MGDTIYGMSGDKKQKLCALWRQLGKEIRISAEIYSNDEETDFNEDNILSLEITDDGNIFETYMKKAVLKIQATDESEEALKELVDNADSIHIEYGVYYDGEICNDSGEVVIEAGTTNLFSLPTMYVSHEETDTDYDEVTKTATFTCYDAMKLLAEIPMFEVKLGSSLGGYYASNVLEKIKEVVSVSDDIEKIFTKKYTIGQSSNGNNLGYSEMTALKNYYKGKTIRDYLNNLSKVLYCAFCIAIDQDTAEEYLSMNSVGGLGHLFDTFGKQFVQDITTDDIRDISLGKTKKAITGLAYYNSTLNSNSKILGTSDGNVLYKYLTIDALKADLLNNVEVRHSEERESYFDRLKDKKLRDFEITTYGMPWLKPLTLTEYEDTKGAVSQLLINSSILTISNGITQRLSNQSIDTLFEKETEKTQDIENLNTSKITVGNSITPVQNKGCDIGSSDERFNTVYCVDTDTTSDLKNKENIESLVDNDKLLDFFKMMKPCSFTMKDGDTGRKHMGFIAQWCAETAKKTMGDLSFFGASYINENGEREYYRDDVDDSKLSWGLKLGQLIAPLWAVVQIQLDKIEDLEKRIEELKNGN
ncbi:MAG: tail fiber domain-containing protein [Eubacteriales bacterium]|nr:tail fiber domain-containing protein [Eubacteriales bacterium]